MMIEMEELSEIKEEITVEFTEIKQEQPEEFLEVKQEKTEEFPEGTQEKIEFVEFELDTPECINVAVVTSLTKIEQNELDTKVKNVNTDKKQLSNANKPKSLKTCEVCSRQFSKNGLKMHMRIHNDERPYKCKVCDKTFRQYGALYSHTFTHSKVKKHLCVECGGSFTLASTLKKHIKRMHESGRKMVCIYCPEVFYNLEAFRTHRREKHCYISGETEKRCPVMAEMEEEKQENTEEFQEVKQEKTEFVDFKLEIDTPEYINVAGVTSLTKTESNELDPKILGETLSEKQTLSNGHKPKSLITCEICARQISTKGFKMHMRIHNDERPYKCKVCDKAFRQYGQLYSHSVTHSKEKKHLCLVCGGSFTLAHSLKKHIQRMHQTGKDINCKDCSETFCDMKAYRTHRTEKHFDITGEDKRYFCVDCGTSYTAAANLRKHKRRVHEKHSYIPGENEKGHLCVICGASFTAAASLKKHKQRIHESGKKFDCKYCPETFYNYQAYTTHKTEKHFNISVSKKIKTEESEQNLQNVLINNRSCILCREEFNSIESYIVHMYNHLQYTKEELNEYNKIHKFPCKICKEKCSSLDIIMVHMATHMEKTYECDKCKEKFSYFLHKQHEKQIHENMICKICKETLQGTLSLQLHHLEKHSCPMWICVTCQSVYTNKITLERHVRAYHRYHELLQRIYKCESCEKVFYSKPILKRHVYISHPLRTNISCDKCDLKFKYPYMLNQHIRKIHQPEAEEKTYLCYVCKESFKSFKSYRAHVQSHKTTKYQCKDCCLIFRNKRGFSKHLKRSKCPNRTAKNTHSNKINLNEHSLELSKTICRFCLLEYGTEDDLKKHFLENHQDEKAFHCFHCDVGFHTVEKLNQHCGNQIHKKRVSAGRCIKTGDVVKTTEKQQCVSENFEFTTVKLELDEDLKTISETKSEVIEVDS